MDDQELRLCCIRDALDRAKRGDSVDKVLGEAQKIYNFCTGAGSDSDINVTIIGGVKAPVR